MKNCNKQINLLFRTVLVIMAITVQAHGQLNWIKSSNNNLYYHTDTRFTWSGGGYGGYCNGYGTIQWYNDYGTRTGSYTGYIVNGKNEGYGVQYYSNGQKYYEGYWKNDEKSGYGTLYAENGAVQYQGQFEHDRLKGLYLLESAGYETGKYIMDEIFDGGINLQTSIIRSTAEEAWLQVKFNGDIINSNKYEFILAIGKKSPSVSIPYMNGLAKVYLSLKVIDGLATEIDKLFNN